jgi:hypothetical protein
MPLRRQSVFLLVILVEVLSGILIWGYLHLDTNQGACTQAEFYQWFVPGYITTAVGFGGSFLVRSWPRYLGAALSLFLAYGWFALGMAAGPCI